MSIDERIAHHEAGHIVAARLLGISIADVTMSPTGDSEAGVQIHTPTCLMNDGDPPSQVHALEDMFKVALAGPHAELRYQPDNPRKEHLSRAEDWDWGGDMRQAQGFVAQAVLLTTGRVSSLSEADERVPALECKPLFDRLYSETEALVAENWPSIQRIAKCLQRQRTITQQEADALIRG